MDAWSWTSSVNNVMLAISFDGGDCVGCFDFGRHAAVVGTIGSYAFSDNDNRKTFRLAARDTGVPSGSREWASCRARVVLARPAGRSASGTSRLFDAVVIDGSSALDKHPRCA